MFECNLVLLVIVGVMHLIYNYQIYMKAKRSIIKMWDFSGLNSI